MWTPTTIRTTSLIRLKLHSSAEIHHLFSAFYVDIGEKSSVPKFRMFLNCVSRLYDALSSRRQLKDKIIDLKKELNEVSRHRNLQRRSRKKLGLPVIALVGYTNAGKSTLLNSLTRAGVMAENMLFATLDPTTRKVKLTGLKVRAGRVFRPKNIRKHVYALGSF